MFQIFRRERRYTRSSERKVNFSELAPTPKRERSTRTRKKTFQTHLLTSPENKLIIQNADKKSTKTQEAKEKREKLAKELVKKHNAKAAAERRAKKKIPIRGGPKL